MDFSGLFELVEGVPAFRELARRLGAAARAEVEVLEAARPFTLVALFRSLGCPMLVMTGRSERAKALREELQAWGLEETMLFPEPDPLPYERLPWDPATVQARLQALHALLRWRPGQAPPLVVASAPAVARPSPDPAAFSEACQIIRSGDRLEPGAAMSLWLTLGYRVAAVVEVPGTVARRGGILDIYPFTAEAPARLEMVGDRVESLRRFHPDTQRSLGLLASLEVTPAWEMVPGQGLVSLDDQRLDEEIAKLLSGHAVEAPELYFPLLNRACLLDYLPSQGLLALEEVGSLETSLAELDEEAKSLRQGLVEGGDLPEAFPRPYFLWPELEAHFKKARSLVFSSVGDEGAARLPFRAALPFGGRLEAWLDEVKSRLRDGRRLVVVSQQASRLAELLEEEGIMSPPQSSLEQPLLPGSLSLLQSSLASGWSLELEGGSLTIFTDAEAFGLSRSRRRPRRRFLRREEALADLSPGDYVVHVDHGVARFAGLARLGLNGAEREYLVLEYAAGDKLYVPTEVADRVGRYIGSGGAEPHLTRLGTQEWARAKRRAREAASELAGELMELYSAREVARGIAFAPDTLWQRELEASFPYEETPDQLRAVAEVKADMESPRPMDRLVCGDVGYGKTEVALRAAFKAVQEGSQVAVLVPTTVLAQQHYQTFHERLKAFPVRVAMLSRFLSDGEQREVVRGLALGTVDICIGTHRILQKDVSFKNLGLVIVDEEQRFGVAQKERLKQLRREVDVLTLSATPIPRTLYMSLASLRDMSTMETPPEERQPIKTYVGPYEPRLVREAILREMERGGQVFFVHNRVQSIASVARELGELVPEADIAIAHGQMPEEGLEAAMLDFASGKHDVLACTTIIESGLDIPNVNTLIVNRADRLGLSQLYQLRGRVGRGSERAYAYFFYDKGRRLSPTAERRLKTIFEATELGAGFRIAMKDLEIRGAGNLLGSEQSGHIGAVGFDLYCRILAQAVEELRAKPVGGSQGKPGTVPSLPPPSLNLPLAAYISEGYVLDPGARLNLYQRLALAADESALDDLEAEMIDRFGPAPEAVRDLLYAVRLKVLGTRAGASSISVEEGEAVVRLRPQAGLGREELSRLFRRDVKVLSNQVRLKVEGEKDWKGRLLKVVAILAKGAKAPL
ncbi:MAG: transcription-repair coupling factor [Chloroflexi bacterium]|nr:transcription-repair coupling factor [Chloroflexota bacterium]